MNWNTFLEEEKEKDYYKTLMMKVEEDYQNNLLNSREGIVYM